jgi:hypothetical protein
MESNDSSPLMQEPASLHDRYPLSSHINITVRLIFKSQYPLFMLVFSRPFSRGFLTKILFRIFHIKPIYSVGGFCEQNYEPFP